MKRLLAFLGIFIVLTTQAQHPYYWSLTEDDGLPSNVVYDMLQDSRGYIWLGTDKGLVRLNGHQVQTYLSSAQKSLSVTSLNEDKQGRIWGVNFSQQLFFAQADSLHELELPQSGKVNGHVKIILLDNWLYVYSYGQADRLNLSSMEWDMDFYGEHWPVSEGTEDRKVLYSISGSGTKLAFAFSGEMHQAIEGKPQHILKLDKKFKYHRSCWFKGSQVLVRHGFWPLLKFEAETGDTTSIRVEHPRFSNSTRMLVCRDDGAGNLWLCTSDGALIIDSQDQQIYFPEHQITRVIEDREGNLWFATLQHGVHVVPNTEILVYNGQNSDFSFDEINSIGLSENEEILVGSFDGTVHRLAKDGSISNAIDLGFRKEVNGFVSFQNDDWAFGEQIVSLSSNAVKTMGRPVSIKQIERLKKNDLAIVSSEGFSVADFSNSTSQLPSHWKPADAIDDRNQYLIEASGVRKYTKDPNADAFYLSTTDGLSYHTKSGVQELKTEGGKSVFSLDMDAAANGQVWVSTVSNGILVFEGTELKQTIKPEFFQEPVQFTGIEVENGIVWAVSTNGLFRIDASKMTFEKFDVSDGLPTNSINDLLVHDGFAWLATMKGLVKIPTDLSCKNTTAPRLEIAGVSVNDKPVSELEKLHYQQNNVAFELSPIAFRNRGKATVHYRLVGLSDEWKKVPVSQANAVSFLALRGGDYTFEVKLLNEDGIESQTLTRSFSISPPFWQTWWFYVLLAGSTIVLVSGIFLFRIREIRKRGRVQHDLRASELTALKAQMNPHFVFNALNSIQDYILLNQTELANDYLGKFARLMRKTLDQSQQHTVTLTEEIDLLKLYLELEAIRFEDEFEYEVKVDESLNIEQIEIPAMIVQPFVENAIKHGLLHKKEDRKLLVDFKMNGNVLESRIEDNGIGLEASKQLNAKRQTTHRSFGTGAIKKRLDLLNQGRKERISVEMKDVTNRAADISGTHVLLRVPILNTNEHA